MSSSSHRLDLPWWGILLVAIGALLTLICLCVVGPKIAKKAKYIYLSRKKTQTLSKYSKQGVVVDELEDSENEQEWFPFKNKNNNNNNNDKNSTKGDSRSNNNSTNNNENNNGNDNNNDTNLNNGVFNDDELGYKGFESNVGDFYDSEDIQQTIQNVKNSHKKIKKYSKKYKNNHKKGNIDNDANAIEFLFENNNSDIDESNVNFRIVIDANSGDKYIDSEVDNETTDQDIYNDVNGNNTGLNLYTFITQAIHHSLFVCYFLFTFFLFTFFLHFLLQKTGH